MSKGVVTVAGIQFAGIAERKSDNLKRAINLIEEAADKGGQIVVSPEVALTGFVGGDVGMEMAETIPGETTKILCELEKNYHHHRNESLRLFKEKLNPEEPLQEFKKSLFNLIESRNQML